MADIQHSILVVDDSRMNIEILSDVLKSEYNVLCATNGKDALEIARRQVPDIILLDVIMPEMNGYEICTSLKSDPLTQNIPIIFITGQDQEEDEAKGLEAGAIDYITKPIRPSLVRARVHNHLQLKIYRDCLENLSTTDGLTGIPNRRMFDQVLKREWRRSLRDPQPLSLIMVDIDYFKQYNDLFGHMKGDDCLRRIAQSVRECLRRPSDVAARYGGEEFACILPDTDLAGALVVARHIQTEIEALNIPHTHSKTGRVTLSMGVSSMVPAQEQKESDLVNNADANLYAAKNGGRNRIIGGQEEAA
jgi:diguanylate cyclase (GGDEF)-like protein